MTKNYSQDDLHQGYIKVLDQLDICDPKHSAARNASSKNRYWGILAKIMFHEDSSVGRNSISRKYNGHMSIRPYDLSFVQLLMALEKSGVDLKEVQINDRGDLQFPVK